nr:pumilio domain containing protein [Hymenolepis microstoma]
MKNKGSPKNSTLGFSEKSKKHKRMGYTKKSAEEAFTKFDDVDMPEDQQYPKKFTAKNEVPNKKLKDKRFSTKKERRQARLQAKKHSDIVPELLADWEILRRDSTETSKKHELIEKMIASSKAKLMDLSRARDTSRIIESMIQLGTEAQRWAIFAELKNFLRYLAMSQYGKHVVIKLINYGAKEHRLELFKVFRGYAAKLLRHKHAAEVVELLYNDYATASQRTFILQETYGHHFALQLTANNVTSLQQALDLNPDKRATILANLNDLLVTMVSKGLLRLSIVQHLLLEYLTVMLQSSDILKLQTEISSKSSTEHKLVQNEFDDDDKDADASAEMEDKANESQGDEVHKREERLSVLVETILEVGIVSMLHTREGVKASLALLWICPPKERKTLLKSLKTCVASIAENEHGHIFLMGLLDAMDDTKLLAKSVIKEIIEDLEDIVNHPHARKVLLYALSPRDPRHFAPALINSFIVGGDDSPFTKKPLAVRALELRSLLVGLLPALLQLVSGQNQDDSLLKFFVGSPDYPTPFLDRSRIVLLTEILLKSSSHELQFSTACEQFKRSGSRETERLKIAEEKCNSILTAEELKLIENYRTRAVRHFVEVVLALPDFQPIGVSTKKMFQSAEGKRILQAQRRKRALAAALNEGVKKRKTNVQAFTNTEDGEPMDTSAVYEDTFPTNAPFLERPEGQILMSRLIQNDKKGSCEFSRLVCEMVPEKTLQAWLTCNRSCFTLVHLYELNDEVICKKLKEVLGARRELIVESPLAGAKILAKHLFAN